MTYFYADTKLRIWLHKVAKRVVLANKSIVSNVVYFSYLSGSRSDDGMLLIDARICPLFWEAQNAGFSIVSDCSVSCAAAISNSYVV